MPILNDYCVQQFGFHGVLQPCYISLFCNATCKGVALFFPSHGHCFLALEVM
jgi:hypothetical protein